MEVDIGKLDGKVAIVSGAGRGIGRAVAMKLAADGARVVVNDLDDQPAADTVAEIGRLGGTAVGCPGDVVAAKFGDRLVSTALDAFERLDIIVNAAGYTWDHVIQKTTDEQWYAMIDVHLTAPFRILRAAAPYIRDAAKREIADGKPVCRKVVNISSLAGLDGNVGQIAYAAAKAGINGVTKTLCKEWGRYNVTVNTVAFGLIRTRLSGSLDAGHSIEVGGKHIAIGVNPTLLQRLETTIPLGRAGTPEEAAGAVYLFCIPESDYVSGQMLVCGGGVTF
jgi:3-oxoacyl-[acyl-carrier protein] reductase